MIDNTLQPNQSTVKPGIFATYPVKLIEVPNFATTALTRTIVVCTNCNQEVSVGTTALHRCI